MNSIMLKVLDEKKNVKFGEFDLLYIILYHICKPYPSSSEKYTCLVVTLFVSHFSKVRHQWF